MDSVPEQQAIPEAEPRPQGWKKAIAAGIAATFGYAMISVIAVTSAIETPWATERQSRMQPRRADPPSPAIERIVETIIPVSQAIWRAADWPWEQAGIATSTQYLRARSAAFDAARIDPENPEDDPRRFSFYREIGIAVRHGESAYVPFESWTGYLERQGKGDPLWRELEEHFSERSTKERYSLLGKAFYKADSAGSGGNEDGVVDDGEWGAMIRSMGYRTREDTVEEVARKLEAAASKGTLQEEVQGLSAAVAEDPSHLLGDVPEQIPLTVLREYIPGDS